jgi:hypothetical protein
MCCATACACGVQGALVHSYAWQAPLSLSFRPFATEHARSTSQRRDTLSDGRASPWLLMRPCHHCSCLSGAAPARTAARSSQPGRKHVTALVAAHWRRGAWLPESAAGCRCIRNVMAGPEQPEGHEGDLDTRDKSCWSVVLLLVCRHTCCHMSHVTAPCLHQAFLHSQQDERVRQVHNTQTVHATKNDACQGAEQPTHVERHMDNITGPNTAQPATQQVENRVGQTAVVIAAKHTRGLGGHASISPGQPWVDKFTSQYETQLQQRRGQIAVWYIGKPASTAGHVMTRHSLCVIHSTAEKTCEALAEQTPSKSRSLKQKQTTQQPSRALQRAAPHTLSLL